MWNPEQQSAIDSAVRRQSFALTGSAGTGKTTVSRGILQELLSRNAVPPLEASTKWLAAGAPGIAILSFTNRAARNIAKAVPPELASHCITFHKLLEFGPEFYEEETPTGEVIRKMRFAPARHYNNPLPVNLRLLVIEESSMVACDLFQLVLDALPIPHAVQFIFLGDINQLPPIYGQSILGQKLVELPVVELRHVYRQAKESPIIAAALAVKDNSFAEFNKRAVAEWGASRHFALQQVTEKLTLASPLGSVSLIPWKKTLSADTCTLQVCRAIPDWISSGLFNPDEDLMLCPWNESFGTKELNLAIAQYTGDQRGAVVHEIIAGFSRHYWAVGDRMLVEKQEAIITQIVSNPRYMGEPYRAPSSSLTRKGKSLAESELLMGDVDDLLAAMDSGDDRVNQASHCVTVRFSDTGETLVLSSASEINNTIFAYAITVHKAQGSEARKVFFITAACHNNMLSRELVYTALTRAKEELIILMAPNMLATAASRPRIKGDTLAEKLAYLQSRQGEKLTGRIAP